jgi:transposase InsO family protein
MLRLLVAAASTLRSSFQARHDLVLENLALRQQLATLAARRRPALRPVDRAFWVILRRVWAPWRSVLIVVEPDTVVRWHRAGFRLYWAWLSRRRTGGRPRLPRDVRALVQRMATENTWGAPRIHGELLRLGFAVSERSVSRFLSSLPRPRRRGPSWTTFLRTHREALAAMDLLTVPTATFRLLYVLVVVHHGRREAVHCAVTDRPTAAWVAQQLREAFPFDSAPRMLVHDRDAVFGEAVASSLRSMGITPIQTTFRSPWQNGVAERFIGSVRRELLDHVIVLGEEQLRRLMRQYVEYYNEDRTHLAIGKDAPRGRPVEPCLGSGARVVALPRVGGLHRRYAWRRAA